MLFLQTKIISFYLAFVKHPAIAFVYIGSRLYAHKSKKIILAMGPVGYTDCNYQADFQ
jgi:hypothetical protein